MKKNFDLESAVQRCPNFLDRDFDGGKKRGKTADMANGRYYFFRREPGDSDADAISPLSRTIEMWLQRAGSDTEASQKRRLTWLSSQRVVLRAIILQDRSLISNYFN